MKRPIPLDNFADAMTVDDAAAALGIGSGAAYRGVAEGAIPSLRVGARIIIPREALRRYLAEATGTRRAEKPRLLKLREVRR
jgi:excisionase family DNA binding protein